MLTIHFHVPGQPVGKGRPRIGMVAGHARMFTPEKTVSYESTVALFAAQAMAGRPLLTGPVNLQMRVDFAIPASWSMKKQRAAEAGQILPAVKPDADNVAKAICDAINGVVWKDDVQVVDLTVRKRYSMVPGVAVQIESVEIA
jgi:Holliday junction resolvase RusA-like endonuclease